MQAEWTLYKLNAFEMRHGETMINNKLKLAQHYYLIVFLQPR